MSSSKSVSNSKDQPEKVSSSKNRKKIKTNLAEDAGRANGSEKEPGAEPMETLKRKTLGFSLVEFLNNPRWVVTIQRKFHEEIIELFREIKSTDSKDILDKYHGIEPALVNQIQ